MNFFILSFTTVFLDIEPLQAACECECKKVAQKDFKPQQIHFEVVLNLLFRNNDKNKVKVNIVRNFAKTHYEHNNKPITIVHSNLCDTH